MCRLFGIELAWKVVFGSGLGRCKLTRFGDHRHVRSQQRGANACNKEFSKILTIPEHEKGGIVCPHCKSKDVEQRWAAFYAVTSKKS